MAKVTGKVKAKDSKKVLTKNNVVKTKVKTTEKVKKVKAEKPMSALKAKRAKIPTFPPPKVTFMDKALKGEISCFGFFDKVVDEETGKETEVLNQEKFDKFIAEFDSYVDLWFEDVEGCNLLNDYLGLTPKEYKSVLSNPTNIEKLVLAKRGLKNK